MAGKAQQQDLKATSQFAPAVKNGPRCSVSPFHSAPGMMPSTSEWVFPL